MTNVLLLPKHTANLEPYVGMGERAQRIAKYAVKAMERLTEGFLNVIERAILVIENTNAI